MTTRRLTIALLGILFSVALLAAKKDLTKDITMVSYEQSWIDSNGTLALRNNSSEEVKNVVFVISYLDMSGNELDYKEFSRTVVIAPGKTKKIDIPAYEHDRHYHYYKTKDDLGYPNFKINFKLKDYNVEETELNSDEDTSSINGLPLLFLMMLLLLFLAIYSGLYVLVAVMAHKRRRSVVAWLLISLIASPLLIIIILLLIGKNDK